MQLSGQLLACAQGNNPQYALHWKLGGPRNWSGYREEEEENIFLFAPESKPQFLIRPALKLVAIPTELSGV
jgi:hypothetical protein